MRNFYEILNIPKTASDEEIKKAYKKLAIKLHPDRKGGDEEKFKELAAAYEVLSDKNKRQIYDQFGEEGLKQGGMPNMDPFNMFFNMDSFFHGRNRGKKQQKKCEPVIVQIEVTLEQLYNGDNIIKTLKLNKICQLCKGTGAKDDHKPIICNDCNGKGIKFHRRQIGPGMVQQLQSHCTKCNGEGKIIDDKYKCTICNGKKVIKHDKKLDITINSHLHHGQKILHPNKGEEYPGHERGDIMIIIVEKEHDIFKRLNKHDLYIKRKINLVEALTGCSLVIEHLDKRKIHVEINEVIKPKTFKKIMGEGIPLDKGDLIIEFEIEFPTKVDSNDKEKLEKILMQKTDIPNIINGYKEAYLYDYNPEHHNEFDKSDDNQFQDGPAECHTQ